MSRSKRRWTGFIVLVLIQAAVVIILANWSNFSVTSCTMQTLPRRTWHSKENSSVFQTVQLPVQGVKPVDISLFVAVLTHPSRRDRRYGIRDTWMRRCEERRSEVVCKFFTDGAGLGNETKLSLLEENKENQDMEFLPIAGTIF